MQDIKQRLYRRKDSARVLGCSESMVIILEQRGVLHPIRLESLGARMVRHAADEVDALASRLIAEATEEKQPA